MAGFFDSFNGDVSLGGTPTEDDKPSKMAQLLRSVARGAPQAVTGFVDLAALPFTATGMMKSEDVVGSTDYLTKKGLLPPAQPGLGNQTAEVLAGGLMPLSPTAIKQTVAGVKALAPKAYDALENYMVKSGGIQPITAWHGTPHKIEGKFDISKVGTGEGAQAYGHGMYFAENPDVAKGYQRDLANHYEPYLQYGKQKISGQGLSDTDLNVFKYLETGKKHAGEFPHNTQYYAKKIAEEAGDVDALKKLQEHSDIKFGEELNRGNLYKVDIPDEHIATMMDWDKPLGKQSSVVKKAVSAIKSKVTPEMMDELGGDLNLLFGKDVTPNQFLNTLEIIHPESTIGIGEQWLNDVGVKGIRYLDGMSRSGGKGSSNFVVFDPSTVQILEENGKLVNALRGNPDDLDAQMAKLLERKRLLEQE